MKKKWFIIALVFTSGYMINDVIDKLALELVSSVHADVAGMNYRELRRDRDFKKAVKYVVESNCTATGYVDDGYVYLNVSC